MLTGPLRIERTGMFLCGLGFRVQGLGFSLGSGVTLFNAAQETSPPYILHVHTMCVGLRDRTLHILHTLTCAQTLNPNP